MSLHGKEARYSNMSEETTRMSQMEVEDPPQPAAIKPYCPVTVEPILCLMFMAASMIGQLRPQYIYYRLGNGTVNQRGSSCYGNSSNSSAYEDRQSDQAETIQWTTAIQLASGIPSLVVAVIIGSLSDKLGRKLHLIIPIVGLMVNYTVAAFVVQFNLPLVVLLPGTFISGLGGGFSTLNGGSFAYVADITVKGKSRYFRHALLQAVLGVSAIAAALGGNTWFQKLGYPSGILQPFWFASGVSAFCLFYTIFALKETCPRKPGGRLCALSNITGIVRLFKVKRKTPTWPICVLGLADFLLLGIFTSLPSIVITFLVGPPFCFSPDLVGYFGVAIGGSFIVSMIAIKIFSNYPYGLMAVGFTSAMGYLTLMGLASYSPNLVVTVFVGPAIACLQTSTYTVLRTTMSKMVRQEEQGSLFGLISFYVSLASVVFVPLWNFVYSSTIAIMPGLVFFIMVGVQLFCTMLVGFVKFKVSKKFEENDEEQDKEERERMQV